MSSLTKSGWLVGTRHTEYRLRILIIHSRYIGWKPRLSYYLSIYLSIYSKYASSTYASGQLCYALGPRPLALLWNSNTVGWDWKIGSILFSIPLYLPATSSSLFTSSPPRYHPFLVPPSSIPVLPSFHHRSLHCTYTPTHTHIHWTDFESHSRLSFIRSRTFRITRTA